VWLGQSFQQNSNEIELTFIFQQQPELQLVYYNIPDTTMITRIPTNTVLNYVSPLCYSYRHQLEHRRRNDLGRQNSLGERRTINASQSRRL